VFFNIYISIIAIVTVMLFLVVFIAYKCCHVSSWSDFPSVVFKSFFSSTVSFLSIVVSVKWESSLLIIRHKYLIRRQPLYIIICKSNFNQSVPYTSSAWSKMSNNVSQQNYFLLIKILIQIRGRCDCNRMVVGFTTTRVSTSLCSIGRYIPKQYVYKIANTLNLKPQNAMSDMIS
jgi:hypothetical protein